MSTARHKSHRVHLTAEERQSLRRRIDSGTGSTQARRRANILLLTDESLSTGGLSDARIAEILGVGTATVERTRKQCVMEGIEATLDRKVQVNRKKRLLDGEGEAKLTMLACSEPPEGHAKWSLRLLGAKLVELEIVETISKDTVRRALKKTN